MQTFPLKLSINKPWRPVCTFQTFSFLSLFNITVLFISAFAWQSSIHLTGCLLLSAPCLSFLHSVLSPHVWLFPQVKDIGAAFSLSLYICIPLLLRHSLICLFILKLIQHFLKSPSYIKWVLGWQAVFITKIKWKLTIIAYNQYLLNFIQLDRYPECLHSFCLFKVYPVEVGASQSSGTPACLQWDTTGGLPAHGGRLWKLRHPEVLWGAYDEQVIITSKCVFWVTKVKFTGKSHLLFMCFVICVNMKCMWYCVMYYQKD